MAASTLWMPEAQVPNSAPRAVSIMTWSPGGKGQAVGVKKVDLLARAELDVHHLPLFFFHLFFHECLLYFRRAKNSQPHTAAGETLP